MGTLRYCVRLHGNMHSSDVTWLLKTEDVCVKCSVTFAILGYLCFLCDTMEEIESVMGVVIFHFLYTSLGLLAFMLAL